jgi:hypothetical protein
MAFFFVVIKKEIWSNFVEKKSNAEGTVILLPN